MDSMAERLENLLGDEKAVAQLQRIISFLREEGAQPGSAPEQGSQERACSTPGAAPASGQGAPDMLGGMLSLLPGLLGGGTGGSGDPDLALLRALRPFLSSKRKKRVGEAVKLMKLMDMLPLLQQSGLLSGFLGGEENE